MTEDKLTLRDALLYPKAMIVKNATKYINIIAFIVHHPISDEMQYEITNCKLILRSIEQLTDEEKDFIVKEFSFRGRLLGSAFFENVEVLLINCSVDKRVGLIDYLRKQNIMIEPEDWFKSGKAVKDEK